jgi:hypothetical protein
VIIGAEANLAARLQSIAEPGQIVLSYETYALVREMFAAHSLPAIQMKGISRPVVPYVIDGTLASSGEVSNLISEHMAGLDLYLDPSLLDESAAAKTRALLEKGDYSPQCQSEAGRGGVSRGRVRRSSRDMPQRNSPFIDTPRDHVYQI